MKNEKAPSRNVLGAIVLGGIFIAVGVLILLRNIGAIDSEIYRILLSWQMLLIVLGIWALCRRNIVAGVVTAGVGAFFMMPKLMPETWSCGTVFWPFVFILLGIIVLAHLFRPDGYHRTRHSKGATKSDSGFVDINGSFASMKHIVLDKVFEGARIKTSFSGTVLNLKFSSLAEGETYIDVDMTLSGLEIHVPDGCKVETDKISMTLAGVDDKRYYVSAPDDTRKLVIRGNMTMSGIEIK